MKKKTKIDGWFEGEAKHKIVLKDFVTKRSFCAKPSCKFYGKLAEQGVCYHHTPDAQSRHFKKQLQDAEGLLAFNRKHNYKNASKKELIKRLESEIVCYFMNWSGDVEELIWLRGENAKLRAKLGIFKK
jgi:hypothetical protein